MFIVLQFKQPSLFTGENILQCVAGAMYITGFAESISDLLNFTNIWAIRGISLVVLLALLGINLAGVKWIIRLQLLLLFLLAVSTLDFVIGSFTHLSPGNLFLILPNQKDSHLNG